MPFSFNKYYTSKFEYSTRWGNIQKKKKKKKKKKRLGATHVCQVLGYEKVIK